MYVCTQAIAHWQPKYSVAEDSLAAISFVKLNVNLILAKGIKIRCMRVSVCVPVGRFCYVVIM
jgi:hypothetical protein